VFTCARGSQGGAGGVGGRGAGSMTDAQPHHWCRRYCTHLALALVQALLQAPGPVIGAGSIAGTQPLHYCRHPAPILVQALFQAPGPSIGAHGIAGTRPWD